MGTSTMEQLACRVGTTREGFGGLGVLMQAHAWRGSRATQERVGAGPAWERAGLDSLVLGHVQGIGPVGLLLRLWASLRVGLVWSRKLGLGWA